MEKTNKKHPGMKPPCKEAVDFIRQLSKRHLIYKMDLLKEYNEEAQKRGWRVYKSPNSINNALRSVGAYEPMQLPNPEKGKYIFIPIEARMQLLNEPVFDGREKRKISPYLLDTALYFQRDSPLVREIQKEALRLGGILLDRDLDTPYDYIANAECEIDHKNGIWTFVFPDDKTLICDCKSYCAKIIKKGKTITIPNIRTVKQLMALQYQIEFPIKKVV